MPTLAPLPRRLLLAASWFCLFVSARAQDRVAELQAQFNQENEPVRKVKILAKLGDAQFDQVRKDTDDGKYSDALHTVQDYRDEVRTALAALKATGVDAERKPGGFKQLQIHVRKGLRELDETILALPEGQRESFEPIRSDLLNLEKELIDLLFPRQPEKLPDKKKPKR